MVHLAGPFVLGARGMTAALRLWPRGADTERFAPGRRDTELRWTLAPGGELIVGYVGRLAPEADHGAAFADAVEHVLSRPEPTRRATARARAERYGWPAAVAAFLAAHDAPPAGGAVSGHAAPAEGATMAG